MNTAIIQARTGSSRLPSKVLLDLPFGSGKTILEQIVIRLKCSAIIDYIVVATTDNKSDNAIFDLSAKMNVECFRGNEVNVLERYYYCAKKYGSSTILRFCGDNPFIDGTIVDKYLSLHLKKENDYTGTHLLPLGTNIEIFSFRALEDAFANAMEWEEKEHVSPYIRKNPEKKFKIALVDADNELQKPDIRLTIDTEEDYSLACIVYDYLYSHNSIFTLKDVIRLFNEKPWLVKINQRVNQKKVCNTLEEEIEELKRFANIQDLHRAIEFLNRL